VVEFFFSISHLNGYRTLLIITIETEVLVFLDTGHWMIRLLSFLSIKIYRILSFFQKYSIVAL
jgi:hypothetical protein